MKSSKKIGLVVLTSLVVGNMVGSGVFLLPASLASFGTIGIFSWVVTAIGAMFLALVFSRLSTVFPQTGGPYVYCREAFGDFVGFQVAYNYWIYMWVGNAAIAVAFTGYLGSFWPELQTDRLLACFVTVGTVWILTAINLLGVKFAGAIQLVTTILKLFPLALIVIFGFFYVKMENLAQFNVSGVSDFQALSSGAVLTLWAFLGLESACIPADSVKNPIKNIPRATIYGTLIAAIFYILTTAAVMGIIPSTELAHSTAPFADAAGKIFGKTGIWIVSAGAVIACLGTLNGWILMQAQVPMAAAKDGLFPTLFAKVNKSSAPYFGLITSSILVTLLISLNFTKDLVSQFTFIILLATLAAIFAYLYTTVAEIIILRKEKRKISKSFLIKKTTIAICACIYSFWAIISSGQETVFLGTLLMLSSIPIYAFLKAKKNHSSEKLSQS